jgi:hypothetical protein
MPLGSITGTALIALSSSSRATACAGVSGVTVRTLRVMICAAFMRTSWG